MCLHCSTTIKTTSKKPQNWIDKGYSIVVPFEFKWRHKIGSVECDCHKCVEEYRVWYGTTWYHMDNCALLQYIKKKPQIANLRQFYGHDFDIIAQTD